MPTFTTTEANAIRTEVQYKKSNIISYNQRFVGGRYKWILI